MTAHGERSPRKRTSVTSTYESPSEKSAWRFTLSSSSYWSASSPVTPTFTSRKAGSCSSAATRSSRSSMPTRPGTKSS